MWYFQPFVGADHCYHVCIGSDAMGWLGRYSWSVQANLRIGLACVFHGLWFVMISAIYPLFRQNGTAELHLRISREDG